eukprot:TRINITY_DN5491_c0_g1_i1.p1 TRINITY_DN5491_c0_g1~~TRINITY_DN5491_c0_g1_i1.p1  ORF type:complete len:245 (+),score=37.98 TRINITY_DN5491_c0_g1_i1:153-887(+)
MSTPSITAKDVLKLNAPAKGFLCKLTDNVYGIEFLAFKIRDMESKKTVFEIAREENDSSQQSQSFPEDFDFDSLRTIHYTFPLNFLKLKTVGTSLKFKVGDNEVKEFRMIERHYFKSTLIQSYDFTFPFCIPNSTNEWEVIYDMPKLDSKILADIVANPKMTMSDSYYFVEGKLIQHNKAYYTYSPSAQDFTSDKTVESDSSASTSSMTASSISLTTSSLSTSSSSSLSSTVFASQPSKSSSHT